MTDPAFTAGWDRLALRRGDPEWVARVLDDARTRLLPVTDGRVPVETSGGTAGLVLDPAADALSRRPPAEPPILLGRFRDRVIFTAPVDAGDNRHPLHDIREAAGLLPADELALAGTARALVHWHLTHRYCGRCGNATRPGEAGFRRDCGNPECGRRLFPRTDPAVIVLVRSGGKALLGRQRHWDPGRFSTLAGFVEPGETPEQAVAREVLEEAGVETGRAWYRSAQPWPFPGALMLGYHAEAATTAIERHDGELEAARWFDRDQLAGELAAGTLKLPARFSIARSLIRDWFDEAPGYTLDELAGTDPPDPR